MKEKNYDLRNEVNAPKDVRPYFIEDDILWIYEGKKNGYDSYGGRPLNDDEVTNLD